MVRAAVRITGTRAIAITTTLALDTARATAAPATADVAVALSPTVDPPVITLTAPADTARRVSTGAAAASARTDGAAVGVVTQHVGAGSIAAVLCRGVAGPATATDTAAIDAALTPGASNTATATVLLVPLELEAARSRATGLVRAATTVCALAEAFAFEADLAWSADTATSTAIVAVIE